MVAPFLHDIFLSHHHADKPRVRLVERLKAAGVQKEAGLRLWWDERVIQTEDIIALKVDEGLEQSRVLLLCLSPAALASGWVALESMRRVPMHMVDWIEKLNEFLTLNDRQCPSPGGRGFR